MDWTKIKQEYVSSQISLRALSKKYGVSYATVQSRAKREDWNAQRITGEDIHPDIRHAIEETARKLLAMVDRAVGELDSRPMVTKTKVKTEDGECSTERRYYEPGGNVDCKDLKVLTAALKDIRDIQMIRPPLDIREQEAKIRNLERQLVSPGDTAVTVSLEGEVESFAE